MQMKALKAMETESAVGICGCHNGNHGPVMAAELAETLEQARDPKVQATPDCNCGHMPIPEVNARVNVPVVPSQDTAVFNNWKWCEEHRRKTVHF